MCLVYFFTHSSSNHYKIAVFPRYKSWIESVKGMKCRLSVGSDPRRIVAIPGRCFVRSRLASRFTYHVTDNRQKKKKNVNRMGWDGHNTNRRMEFIAKLQQHYAYLIIYGICLLFILIEIDYDNDDIECNLPLLDGAVLSATSALNERGPENARLNGEWIDLIYLKNFTRFVFFCECFFVLWSVLLLFLSIHEL